jgi:hypothetical protein
MGLLYVLLGLVRVEVAVQRVIRLERIHLALLDEASVDRLIELAGLRRLDCKSLPRSTIRTV